MSRAVFTRAFALLLCLAASAAAQDASNAHAPQPSEVFQKAAETPADAPRAFEFELSGFSYHVSANGNGRREKGDSVRRFNLRLESGEEIAHVYFSKYEADLLLVCEAARGDAFVARLEQPSMRARWKQRVPAHDIRAARAGDSLYLAVKGFVARLDLRKGVFVWKHGDLFETREGQAYFGSFEVPSVAGDTVSFREAAVSPRPAKTIRVNRKTGQIIGN
ncbi:MAG TPA: hypothetical protein VHU19_02365 [Pyrinomonadaceae bacterium]|jgi:hypothetical protein|nr:hypothetical protein [Pyrinomonadaceae bacterium]